MNPDLISSHLVFLHGLSGAGKSVLQGALESELSKSGIVPKYLSSGDCFRALAELDPELAKKMSQGNFIQTLEGTMPLLKKTVVQFLDDLKSDKSSVLILDGFLRLPEFESDGVTIPSQVDQVGNAFSIENANGMVKNAWQLYVDVNSIDAEGLMRIRSEKHLKAILKLIEEKNSDNEKILKLKALLEKALEIQGDEKYRLKEVPVNLHDVLDMKMEEIIRNIFALTSIEYKEGIAITKPIQEILGEKVTLRDDDLTFKRRLKRIDEFNTNTKDGLLINDLGFANENGSIKKEQPGRKRLIENGPSRGISLEQLSKSCSEISTEIVSSFN